MNGFREKLRTNGRTNERTDGRTNGCESIEPTPEVGGSKMYISVILFEF